MLSNIKNFGFANTYSFELVGNAVANLTIHQQFDMAYGLLNVFKKEVNRSSLYAYASQLISVDQQSLDLLNNCLILPGKK
ncbi:MAG: hypothetical protein IPG82_21080 [Saprospiraceae bacterium]|nr:hypothetical protein [Saprospiraceae bacterium]